MEGWDRQAELYGRTGALSVPQAVAVRDDIRDGERVISQSP